MRALVLGASGLLGYALYRDLGERPGCSVTGTCHSLRVPGLRPLDLLDLPGFEKLLRETDPDVVFCPASQTHVDRCETDPQGTRRLNVSATLAAAAGTFERGKRFVFFSSDYVFAGDRESYSEEDEPGPLNEYGRQKLEVERALLEAGDKALVLRVSALFGWELRPKNFLLQVIERLRRGETLRVARDQFYNPTYAPNAAAAAVLLAQAEAGGLFHIAGADRVNRVELAGAAARAFGLDAGLLLPVSASELRLAAARPLKSSLSNAKAVRLLGEPLWGLGRSLEHMRAQQDAWEEHRRRLQAPSP